MVTRFYYSYDGPRQPVDLGDDHPWTDGPAPGAGYGFDLVLTKSDRHAAMVPLVTGPVAAGADMLLGCWYSPPLQPQDFTGTVAGLVHVTGGLPDMRIALVRADGSVRSWIYTGVDPALPGTADQYPPLVTDDPAGLTALPFDLVSPSAGDRLRVELGVLGAGGPVTAMLTAAPGADLIAAGVTSTALLTLDPTHPGLYLIAAGRTELTEDPAYPGLYLISGSGLTADPDHPGLYLIGSVIPDLAIDPAHPGLYLITGTELTADPDHPGLYLIGAGLTVDPSHPGLYLIGTS